MKNLKLGILVVLMFCIAISLGSLASATDYNTTQIQLNKTQFGGIQITQIELDDNYPCFLQRNGKVICPVIKPEKLESLKVKIREDIKEVELKEYEEKEKKGKELGEKELDLVKDTIVTKKIALGVPVVDYRKSKFILNETKNWTDEKGKEWVIKKSVFDGYETTYLDYNTEQTFDLDYRLDGKVRIGFNSNIYEITDFNYGDGEYVTMKSYGVALENTHADYDSSMVGWWKFTDDATDSSGEGNDGNLSSNHSFKVKGHIDNGGDAHSVWGDGTYIYLANREDGLRAYTHDGTTFVEAGHIDNGGDALGVWGDGTYIYLANYGGGLRAYTHNGTAFTEAGHIDNGDGARTVWGDGTYIYLANREGGLRAYTHNGTNFSESGHIDNGGVARSVWGDGTYIYLANEGGGLRAYTHNGTAFTEAGHIDNGYTARGVWGDGTYIYLANCNGGLRAYTHNGTAFTEAGHIDDGDVAHSVWGDGTYIYIANAEGGLRAYTHNGTAFAGAGHIDNGDIATLVWGDGTYIYLANGFGGLRSYLFENLVTHNFSWYDFGENGNINIAHSNSLDISENITISLWLKLDEYSYGIFLSKYAGASTGYYLSQDTASPHKKLLFKYGDGTASRFMRSNTELDLDKWYHVVATRNLLGNNTFYINGVFDNTEVAVNELINTSSDVLIGTYYPYSWNGSIDEVAIYNRSLSAVEVLALYNKGLFANPDEDYTSLSDGLMMHQDLAETSLISNTTFRDKSANGNTGTKYGSVLKFDGTNDYVDCGNDSSLNITDAITVSTWIKLSTLPTDNDKMVSKSDSYLFDVKEPVNSSYKVRFYNYGGSSELLSEAINLGNWYHCVAVFDKNGGTNNAKIYINGNLSNQLTNAVAIPSNNHTMHIGAHLGTGQWLNGSIGDTRIYSRALNSTEILTMYQGGVVSDTDLEAHYKMKDKSGTTLTDETANNNDGNLTNFASTVAEYGNTHDTGWNTNETPNVFALDKEDQSNKAMSFDGESDYIDLGNAGSENFTEMTISAWFKPSSFTPDAWRVMLHRNDGDSVGSSMFFLGIETGTNQIIGTIGSNAVGVTHTSGKTGINAQLDTWYHVVSSWNGTTVRTYLDGVEKKNYSLSSADYATANKPAETRIGSSANGSGYLFAGDIANVRIYNRSLNQTDITLLYNIKPLTYSGNYTSGILDAGQKVNWTNMNWTFSNQTAKQNVTMYARTGEIAKPDFADSSLVSMWSLNQTDRDGTTAIDSMDRNNGTANGGLTLGGVGGVFQGENATGLDGSNDYVDCGNDSSLDFGTGDFTLSGWIKTSDIVNHKVILGKGYHSNSDEWLFYVEGTTGVVAFRGDGGVGASGNTAINDDIWHYLVAQRSGNDLKLFIDGDLDKTQSNVFVGRTFTNIKKLTLGANNEGEGWYFDGSIAYASIFNKSLTQDEIMSWSNYTAELLIADGEVLDLPANRFLQYKATLQTNTSETPVLLGVDATYNNDNPNVIISSPLNNSYSNESLNNFTSNLSDDLGLESATIYIYNSTDLVNETTVTFTDSPVSYTWGLVVDLMDGIYTWVVKVFDISGSSATSENYTLTVDSNYPVIEQPISPVDDLTSDSSDINFTANLTDDVGVESITLYIYNSTGDLVNETTDTFPSKPKQTIWSKVVSLVDGVYTWFISIFDTAGNEDSTANRTITLESNLTIRLKLDENSTTTAHDVSANENHATLINSTWGNDNSLVTLTSGEYSTTESGVFTITNEELSWTGIYVTWIYDNRTNSQNVNIARLIVIFTALSILTFLFVLLNHFMTKIKTD